MRPFNRPTETRYYCPDHEDHFVAGIANEIYRCSILIGGICPVHGKIAEWEVGPLQRNATVEKAPWLERMLNKTEISPLIVIHLGSCQREVTPLVCNQIMEPLV